jgi:hypothetical protein
MKGLLGEGGLAAGRDEGLKAGAGERVLEGDLVSASPTGQGNSTNPDMLNTLNSNRDEVAAIDLFDHGELLKPNRVTLADCGSKHTAEGSGRIAEGAVGEDRAFDWVCGDGRLVDDGAGGEVLREEEDLARSVDADRGPYGKTLSAVVAEPATPVQRGASLAVRERWGGRRPEFDVARGNRQPGEVEEFQIGVRRPTVLVPGAKERGLEIGRVEGL